MGISFNVLKKGDVLMYAHTEDATPRKKEYYKQLLIRLRCS